VKDTPRIRVYRSRLTAAGRLQDIEVEIANLLRAFPDLPARPHSRRYAARPTQRTVPVVVWRGRQKLH
jgi:hypothetical protein